MAQVLNLFLVGQNASVTFTITVTFTVSGTPSGDRTETTSFNLIVLNPCLDERYYRIVAPTPLPDIEYTLGTGPQTYAAHGGFSVISPPGTPNLCGDLEYIALFNNQPVDGDPLSYNGFDREFTADSTDTSLEDQTWPYAVLAQFSRYPVSTHSTAPSATIQGNILILPDCTIPKPPSLL